MRPILIALLLGLANCASGVDGLRQGISATASTISAGYRAVGKLDQLKQQTIIDSAKAGHLADAEADFAAYKTKRNAVIKVLDDASFIVEAANAAIPLVERGVSKSKSASAWVQDLLAAGLKVVEALATLGVKIGG